MPGLLWSPSTSLEGSSLQFTQLWSVTVSAAYGCGVPTYAPSARVVNGENAKPYSWPWQVSLQFLEDGVFLHNCGGTLIADRWILTAAHCINFSWTNRVVVGDYDLANEEGAEQIFLIPSEDMFVHQSWKYNCIPCGNDIALIRLSRPVQISDKVQLSCLPPAGELLPNNFSCYASGWGRLYTGGPIPDILQQALLPVVDHNHCTQRDWWGTKVKRSMVCAGGDIRSVCNGDSGGPLNCQGADGRWYVHGVASFVSGYGCNTLKKPSVFTRVSAFNSWIQQTISENSVSGFQ
uniref:pancreatic elastase n=1 Tax=Xenopus tropicalis TaxID=8364 RepID=A0A1B8XX52_XENTR